MRIGKFLYPTGQLVMRRKLRLRRVQAVSRVGSCELADPSEPSDPTSMNASPAVLGTRIRFGRTARVWPIRQTLLGRDVRRFRSLKRQSRQRRARTRWSWVFDRRSLSLLLSLGE